MGRVRRLVTCAVRVTGGFRVDTRVPVGQLQNWNLSHNTLLLEYISIKSGILGVQQLNWQDKKEMVLICPDDKTGKLRCV